MQFDQIVIEPVLTEKSVTQRALSCYVFKVHPAATKIAIKQAVEKAFKVKVQDVNVCRILSKRRVLGRSVGRTSHWKKAYVTLVRGQKIQELEA
jgi:large subunit ribosomal protein L23